MRLAICPRNRRATTTTLADSRSDPKASKQLTQPRPQPRAKKKDEKCNSFYWDISSVFIKTACLATFLVVEGPRRILALANRHPEPKPLFLCSPWGYRMCVCGQHYYDHVDNVADKANPKDVAASLKEGNQQPTVLKDISDLHPDMTTTLPLATSKSKPEFKSK